MNKIIRQILTFVVRMTPKALKIALGQPLEVKSGFLEKLEIQIPWKALGDSPTILKLSGLNILALVKDDLEITPEDEHRQKTAILEQIESQREAKVICKFLIHRFFRSPCL